MTKSVFYSALLCLFSGCTCNQIKEHLLPAFTVNLPNIALTIPPLPMVVKKEMPVGALKTHINMDSTIKSYTAGTLGAAAVHFVKVKKITIKVTNADVTTNLSNFKTARIRIYSDTASTDIADIHFPTTYSDSITILPLNPVDISPYLKGSTLAYNLLWKNRRPTRKFLKLFVDIALSVQ